MIGASSGAVAKPKRNLKRVVLIAFLAILSVLMLPTATLFLASASLAVSKRVSIELSITSRVIDTSRVWPIR